MQDAVVSSLAIHHLDGTEKQVLFKDVASILAPGGSFIIADLTEPMDRFGRKHAANIWDEAVRQRSINLDGDPVSNWVGTITKSGSRFD